MKTLTKGWAFVKMICEDVLNFFFPRYCLICGKRLTPHEHYLCAPCYMHLPRTMYHTVRNNDMEKMFWGVIPVERASAFFHYTSRTKKIVYSLKYRNNPYVGIYLGRQCAKEIKDSGFFEGIDCIMPLSLHWKRSMRRSYNQSDYFAIGISDEMNIPVCTKAVKRVVNNKSQTRVTRIERRKNVENIFSLVHPELIEGKHVLLVDDVTTTGSSITSFAEEVLKAHNTKVSILTISIAGQTLFPKSDNDVLLPDVPISEDRISKL